MNTKIWKWPEIASYSVIKQYTCDYSEYTLDTHIYTNTHSHTQTHTELQTDRHHTHRHTSACKYMRTHRNTQTDIHTHTQTHTYTHIISYNELKFFNLFFMTTLIKYWTIYGLSIIFSILMSVQRVLLNLPLPYPKARYSDKSVSCNYMHMLYEIVLYVVVH